MSRKNKLKKFAELMRFPNTHENFYDNGNHLINCEGEEVQMLGDWNAKHFKKEQPLVLELACGRGEYSLKLSEYYPEKNFIGIDVKGARIYIGAKEALAQGRTNVAFLRSRIEMISGFFAPAEVSEIWITFPDPFLRVGKDNRRLTAPIFLNWYRQFLKPGGKINLKTDSPELYAYTLQIIENEPQCQLLYTNEDIYAASLFLPELAWKTHYEQLHLAEQKTIKFIQFTLS